MREETDLKVLIDIESMKIQKGLKWNEHFLNRVQELVLKESRNRAFPSAKADKSFREIWDEVNEKQKDLEISCIKEAKKNIDDLKVFGNGDMFQLLSKASSQKQGWMKSTKGFDTGVGVVIQVTTQQRNPDGSYAVAEALTFVPGTTIVGDGEDRKIARRVGVK